MRESTAHKHMHTISTRQNELKWIQWKNKIRCAFYLSFVFDRSGKIQFKMVLSIFEHTKLKINTTFEIEITVQQ